MPLNKESETKTNFCELFHAKAILVKNSSGSINR